MTTRFRALIAALALTLFATLGAACGGGAGGPAMYPHAELFGGAQGAGFDAKVAEAEQLWAQRADRAKLEAAIAAWEAAIPLASSTLDEQGRRQAIYDLYVNLSRAHYLLADGFVRFDADNPMDPIEVADEMEALYLEGLEYARRALAAYSDDFNAALIIEKPIPEAIKSLDAGAVGGMYWWSTNLGKWALSRGISEALSEVDNIKAIMDRVLALDPAYFHHAPHRYFGAYYTKLPFPTGDMEQSRKFFDQAISSSPGYIGTYVLMAEQYAIKADDRDLYEQMLNKALAIDASADPEIAPENALEQKKARVLLDNIRDYF